MTESKHVEVSVRVPGDLSWEELTQIEDEASEAVGEVLKEHGLSRSKHIRRIEADYS